jgi:RNA polymerase sigma-70 factor, ECF subfamily
MVGNALCMFAPAHAADIRRYDADEDVIERVRSGDVHGAFHRLLQRHGHAVYRYCRETLRDATLADDVHQQTFIAAFLDLPRFAGRSSVRVWLFAIARHRVVDAIRQRRRAEHHVEDADTTELPDHRLSPAESLDDTRLRQALVAVLGELDEPTRTAILLHYQQGFTFEEMAAICHEKPATLNARVARALRRLRTRIEGRIDRNRGRAGLRSRLGSPHRAGQQ